jgi:hypothetical protein
MKTLTVISILLATFSALLSCEQSSAFPPGSSYVLPPSAPSNWIVNPANPIYSPNPYNNSDGGDDHPAQNSRSSGNSIMPKQKRCASTTNFAQANQSFIDALNNNPSSANPQALGDAMNNFSKCLGL